MASCVTSVNFENVYQRINEFIGDDCKQLSKCGELHNLLNYEKSEIESKVCVSFVFLYTFLS